MISTVVKAGDGIGGDVLTHFGTRRFMQVGSKEVLPSSATFPRLLVNEI